MIIPYMPAWFTAPKIISIQAPPIMRASTRLLRWVVCFISVIADYVHSRWKSQKSNSRVVIGHYSFAARHWNLFAYRYNITKAAWCANGFAI